MADRNYMHDIRVNFHELDKNLADQPGHFLYWGEKWANAEKAVKKRVRTIRAEIAEDPSKFGLNPNPSQASINAKVEDDKELIDLEHKRDLYDIAKEGFRHRGHSLNGMTRLFQSGWWSDIRTPEGMGDEIAKKESHDDHISYLNRFSNVEEDKEDDIPF